MSFSGASITIMFRNTITYYIKLQFSSSTSLGAKIRFSENLLSLHHLSGELTQVPGTFDHQTHLVSKLDETLANYMCLSTYL